MRTVFAALRHAIAAGKNTVLVTILSHTGSAPRGAGSQMLVGTKGLMAGTVGGGAVEGRSIEEAQRLLQEGGSAEICEYPLHPSLKDDIGMVCGGEVTVLLSPVDGNSSAWRDAVEDVEARFRGQTGGTLWLSMKDNSAPIVTDKDAACPAEGYFPVNMPASQRVVIFGAGHISRAVTPLLRMVDFEVVVFDDRPEFAAKEAFPDAQAVLCGSYNTIEELLPLKDDDFIVVLTSGHSNDFQVLEQVLRREFPYVGVIGSAAKTAAINKRLWAAGIPQEATDKVYTPIGTKIGAVTPEEIAVSITGELISVRAEKRN